jgi:putative ABC transport system ATP-binding protein
MGIREVKRPGVPMTSLAIEAYEVTKTYGTGPAAFPALRGVNVRVGRGEFVVLHGPSGSGKSTLLSIFGCLLKPTGGVVRVFGNEVFQFSEAELRAVRLSLVGFVFQGNNLLAGLTAGESVALVLELRGWSSQKARAEAECLLGLVGLWDKIDRKVSVLSCGQCQRVAIARALAGYPPLILADEPTAALDAENGMGIMSLLRRLARDRGHTVITVTDDARTLSLADRIISIEDGLIRA